MKAFDEIYYIDSRKPEAEDILALRLSQLLARYPLPPVYLCIGSDRVTGDSLGPLVGTLLLKVQPTLPVIGTLTDPVHALNLNTQILRFDFHFFAIFQLQDVCNPLSRIPDIPA